MSIHIALHHRTSYRYDRRVNLGPQVVRLRPAPHSRTRILSYSMKVAPAIHFINWQQDPQSNYLARLVFPEPTEELVLEIDLVAEMSVQNPFDFFLEPAAETFPFEYDQTLEHELQPFQLKCPLSPNLEAYLAKVRADVLGLDSAVGRSVHAVPVPHSEVLGDIHHDGGILPPRPHAHAAIAPAEGRVRTIDFLVGVNRCLWEDIKYLIRLEPGVQAPEKTLSLRSGSCRDSAWLLCQLFRHCGLAARFVSGYLIQLTADVKSLDGPSGPEQDFTDLHAWCEVYLPGAGWIGLDPTSGLLAGEGHIPLAATPDPQSAAPISGAVDECEAVFDVQMKVSRIFESPRVTKPYSPEQWAAITRLGEEVDARLSAGNCRLTMGGEPTFVSVDDRDGPEWNSIALGPKKRLLGDQLMKRLKSHFTSGALLHYGQGKWYPGEALPRWCFAAYWRRDGQPIWHREALFADESKSYGFGTAEAERFIEAVSVALGCGTGFILPAYEDAWYYLWKERRLPTNVDPFKSNLANEEDRARLAKIFERGLDDTVGFVLPLGPGDGGAGPRWKSTPWFLRTERCYLIPGDSPIGLRLPLDSLPWVTEADFPYAEERSPLEPRPVLPTSLRSTDPTTDLSRRGGMLEQGIQEQKALATPVRGQSAPGIIRTALCVEPRDGRLYVFMPPFGILEDYLELVQVIEGTAAALGLPVIIEGYPPPFDPRLQVIKVTPDPGVIEVNIHPAQSWAEMVTTTEVLYGQAAQARLTAEKFMLDGRHTGTGGGNHIVLGGQTPAESPFLSRPDLLRSLIGYWQNHPALSFLFSGMFIGPTSQSPRLDEARNDSLYELEIACRQLPGAHACPPWLVDRLFRHLLTDATGNTHRAEFCIDKLYAPESQSGRLGLVEMRAFEMPPHPQMSLAQQLLLRVLIAKFWERPYPTHLVRWGTDIHDRWMLPHFVWKDLCEVIQELRDSGFPMQADWFAPHFEFRFPLLGDLTAFDIQLDLRQALEPWHVLGEEPGAGGTTRYVDSSVERLEVKVRGLTPGRHGIAVGGVAVPLRSTGTNGEAVAGVRYRAWQPSSCLHPTIPVHTPLVFDLVDLWNRRSLAGCTYHVMHPGGRNYDVFPVNAYEAESRRMARFFRHGHTPGPMQPRVVETDPHFPFTLDLRRGS